MLTVSAVDATVLGALHGLTEFLPLSSSGHRALAHILFPSASPGPAVAAAVRVGAIASALFVLHDRLGPAVASVARRVVRPSEIARSRSELGLATVAWAMGASALAFAATRRLLPDLAASPLAVAAGFLLTGALLVSSRWATNARRENLSPAEALLVGVLQGIAFLPGLSGTGATLVITLWLGLRPSRAYELAVLLSIPVGLFSLLVEVPWGSGPHEALAVSFLAAISAFVAGVAGLRLLFRAVALAVFPLFSLWVVPLGFATMALAWAWPASP